MLSNPYRKTDMLATMNCKQCGPHSRPIGLVASVCHQKILKLVAPICLVCIPYLSLEYDSLTLGNDLNRIKRIYRSKAGLARLACPNHLLVNRSLYLFDGSNLEWHVRVKPPNV